MIDSIKHEIRKYFKRERNKKLPEEALFWDFDCRFGQSGDEAEPLRASEIVTALDSAKEAGWERCYVEIIAKPSYKAKADAGEEEES